MEENAAIETVAIVREKATLNDFLAKKIKKEENKTKTIDIYVTAMDKTITLVNATEDQILDYANAIGDNTDLKANLEANRQLIYTCCPELQTQEVQDGLEIKDPRDTTRVLFDMEDVKEIMNQFNTLLSNASVTEEIKNS